MTIEELQGICAQLAGVTEDIKWEHNLCFSVCGKMFLIVNVDDVPVSVSFKVPAEEFATLSAQAGIVPAPYLARYHWVLVQDIRQMGHAVWEHYTRQSYQLVAEKLPKKLQQSLGI